MAYDKNNKDERRLRGEALGWDDEISDEGGEYPVLEAGDYNFTVESFQRKRFNGSEKMCACNQVVLKLRIDCPEGVTVEDNLFLNRKTEWKVSQFFIAIGQKQPGVPLRPNWDALPGSRGRCKLYIDNKTICAAAQRRWTRAGTTCPPASCLIFWTRWRPFSAGRTRGRPGASRAPCESFPGSLR